MLRWLRQLHLPLAAKCQLFFGVAVVITVVATLLLPWRRTEQLSGLLDEGAARAVAEQVLGDHVRGLPVAVVTANMPVPEGVEAYRPRLVGVTESGPTTRPRRRFETRSLSKFVQNPTLDIYAQPYDRSDGSRGYRLARALYSSPSCVRCHDAVAASTGPEVRATDAAYATAPGTTRAASIPTTGPDVERQPQLLGILSVDIPSQINQSQVMLNRFAFVAAGLLAGALAIAVFYLITERIILKPVRVLQETAEMVSRGDLNIRSDIYTGDEFQQLSQTFNTMLTNLEQSAEQLRANNKNLDTKLGQLAETNVALYESNRLKSEFLANVSHELRTPLNSIIGFAGLLREAAGRSPDEKSTRYLQNIVTAGRNLLDLINDLLDLAKIEAGRMEVRSEPLSLPALFEVLSNVLRPLLEAKHLALMIRVQPEVPILETDGAKVQQILYNLLSNAIKFSPAHGRIWLSAKRLEDGLIQVEVRDEGPGVPEEKQAVIFEKFRQADGSVTREHGGTGLGLAISRELSHLLGGNIGVDSAPGEGALFWVRLPPSITAGQRDVRGTVSLT